MFDRIEHHLQLILLSSKQSHSLNHSLNFQGIEYLTKGCEMNNATACFYLSGMHISGIEKSEETQSSQSNSVPPPSNIVQPDGEYVVVKDMHKAFTFAYKACELKNMYACANLSQMYARGDGTEKNEEKAEKFKKIALEMQSEVRSQKTLDFQQTM